ncbi:MAG TPA: serine protease [Methylomirabilota bacterium]|nr:serine protease [Methylomirabilota bacterium]
MKRRTAWLLALLCAVAVNGQEPAKVRLKVRAALYDRDLNIKPVPRLAVKLTPIAPTAGNATMVVTSLEGSVETEIVPGKYRVTTEKGAELFDKLYRWDLEAEFTKKENLLELSNDNAKIEPVAAGREAHIDTLAAQYKRVKDSVVTVWTEDRAFDGTIIDEEGLVLTVQHQLKGAEWLAVQLDDARKLPAVKVAQDEQADVTVLRFDAKTAGEFPVASVSTDPESLVEGERVFTVENPGNDKNKKLLTGVLSKADNEQIVSDIKLGYVGSPLFNSSGSAVGIAQYRENKMMMRPIGAAKKVIEEAKGMTAKVEAPARLLPVVPPTELASADLRAPGRGHWESEFYQFKLGDFYVDLITPVAAYELRLDTYNAEMKEYGKHPKGHTQPTVPDDKYTAALIVAVYPQTKMGYWENFGRNGGPPVRHYKNGFSKMMLLCGDHVVEPVWPHRTLEEGGGSWNVVMSNDSTGGRYVYRSDAIQPSCGTVKLRIVATKKEDEVLEKVLDQKVVQRIWEDYEPYRAQDKAENRN